MSSDAPLFERISASTIGSMSDEKKVAADKAAADKAAADKLAADKAVATAKSRAAKKGEEVMVRHVLPGPVTVKAKGKVESVNDDGTLEVSVPSTMPRSDGRAHLSRVPARNLDTERGLKIPPAPCWWPVEDDEPAAFDAKKK